MFVLFSELGPQIHWSHHKLWAGALRSMGDHSEILVEVKTHNEKASTAQDSALAVGEKGTITRHMEEKQKVATLLNWMTDKGQKIYKEQLIFPTEEPNKKDKNKLKDVLEVFEAHFTPLSQ